MTIKTTANALELFQAAQAAQALSYSPYSQFKVGAAIRCDDGSIHSGCNVENAAFPLSQCAEASAIGIMIGSGKTTIKEVLVLSPNDNLCPPCGGCRQKLLEFSSADTLVHMSTASGDITTVTMAELLPYSFDKSDLDRHNLEAVS